MICLYHNHIRQCQSVHLQHLAIEQKLGELLDVTAAALQTMACQADKCRCFQWYLFRRSEGMAIPNLEGSYAYQARAAAAIDRLFSLRIAGEFVNRRSEAEKKVIRLYLILCSDINKIPDSSTQEWFLFGFCYCTNSKEREALRAAYLRLAEKHMSLREVVLAWEAGSLRSLMEHQGVDITLLVSKGIEFRQPPEDEFPIYRFVAEVQHIFRGLHCCCSHSKCEFRSKHEKHLSLESEVNYGFHGTNTWERWQLLKLYSLAFTHQKFSPRDRRINHVGFSTHRTDAGDHRPYPGGARVSARCGFRIFGYSPSPTSWRCRAPGCSESRRTGWS